MTIRGFAALLLFVAATPAGAEDVPVPGPAAAQEAAPTAADYCANFADKASDARLAWQTENLQKLQGDVTRKIAELEAKQAEIQGWIAKRDLMLKAAGKELVDIYAKMDPEAAAVQLAQLDVGTSTSVLRQLNPRNASAILNVMEPKRAAALVSAIAAETLEKPKPAPEPVPAGNGT
jgi:flagellar motility protein MotE (MotC chaperone)